MTTSASKLFSGCVLFFLLWDVTVFTQATVPQNASLALIKDAADAVAAGNLQKAETELKSVLAENPKEYHALNLLGIVRAQQHREAEAERLFEQAILLKSDFVSAHVDLGLLFL